MNEDTNVVTVEFKKDCGRQCLCQAGRLMGRALITSVRLLFLINTSVFYFLSMLHNISLVRSDPPLHGESLKIGGEQQVGL